MGSTATNARNSLRRLALLGAVLITAATSSACGGEERRLEPGNVEPSLRASLQTHVGDLEIRRVECVFLDPELTRCFAQGRSAGGDFRFPVSVRGRPPAMKWSVTASDLRDARASDSAAPLALGRAITVERPAGPPVRIRLSAPGDELKVAYPRVPPKRGHRYLAVAVQLRNKGTRVYEDRPRSRISGSLSDGSLVAAAPIDDKTCTAAQLCRIRLRGGEEASGHVVFEIPARLKLLTVALQVEQSEEVLEWQVEPGASPT